MPTFLLVTAKYHSSPLYHELYSPLSCRFKRTAELATVRQGSPPRSRYYSCILLQARFCSAVHPVYRLSISRLSSNPKWTLKPSALQKAPKKKTCQRHGTRHLGLRQIRARPLTIWEKNNPLRPQSLTGLDPLSVLNAGLTDRRSLCVLFAKLSGPSPTVNRRKQCMETCCPRLYNPC
jgi:hypothetical protein